MSIAIEIQTNQHKYEENNTLLLSLKQLKFAANNKYSQQKQLSRRHTGLTQLKVNLENISVTVTNSLAHVKFDKACEHCMTNGEIPQCL